MNTSRKYYEANILEFTKYRRGRPLAQFCRNEGIGYDWMLKEKRKYIGYAQEVQPERSTEKEEGDLI